MNPGERRAKHRRFSDRRVALMLDLHVILFDDPPGPERDLKLIEEIRLDFEADRAALVVISGENSPRVIVSAGSWDGDPLAEVLDGEGLGELLEAQKLAEGAVTLTYTRRPSMFTSEGWDQLWSGDLGAPAAALLSVELRSKVADRALLWLQEASSSREWSSHDRDLAEEVASLLERAADRVLGGG